MCLDFADEITELQAKVKGMEVRVIPTRKCHELRWQMKGPSNFGVSGRNGIDQNHWN
jgi:hypothetical protein